MPKLTAPIQEVSRLLDLVPYLSTHSHISLKELSQEFGVTEREMANELTALSMCGLPGYTPYELIEVFFDSGFVTINNHDTLDLPRALTSVEAASLLLGLQLMKEEVPSEDERLQTAIENLVNQLSALVNIPIQVSESPHSEFLPLIYKAIASRELIELQYLSSINDSVSSRTVSPYEIVEDRGHTYLNAFCIESQAQRSFRIDRIVSAETSLLKLESSSHSQEDASGEIEVELKIARSKRDFSETFALREVPASGVVTVEVFSEEWLLSRTRVFAPDLEILAPPEIRGAMKSNLEKILSLYTP